MSLEIWFSFVAASIALLAIPGPVVMLLIGYTLGYGRSVSWAAIPGVVLGDFAAMTLSLLGAGAILSASATLFTLLKLGGAAYLLWLGIKFWRTDTKSIQMTALSAGGSRMTVFRHAFIVTALNPKDIVFFVAFLPQFITTTGPALPQLFLIETTFLSLVLITNLLWITLGDQLRAKVNRPSTLKIINRVGAGCLFGAGAMAALK